MELPENIENKIMRDQKSGCWLWTGAINSSGYGNSHIRGVGYVGSHRLVYELLRRSIPKGLDLDHLCRVRRCVNPDHLEPVSRYENLRRGGVIDRLKATAIARHSQTHCVRGHELVQSNIYTYPNGRHRSCRECMREHWRVFARKKRAKNKQEAVSNA